MEEYRNVVSVIVLTYNPALIKLKETLLSILNQKDISYEIIVTDDGSTENYFDDLRLWFKKFNFENYYLIETQQNTGTCMNYLRGLKHSSGRYIKVISPGDLLADEFTLRKWVTFMEKHNSKVSFGNIIYYSDENEFVMQKVKCQPQRKELYNPNCYKEREVILNYIFLLDPVVGAALLIEYNTLCKYLELLAEKVTYSEDNMFRIMVFDNIHLDYFDETILLYEYGSGISTSGNDRWAEIIRNEIVVTNKIISQRLLRLSFYNLRVKILLSLHFKGMLYTMIKYIFFPKLIYWQVIKNTNVCYSEADNNKITYYYNDIKRICLDEIIKPELFMRL